MIKLEHTVLPSSNQMQFVIEGMRNAKNSWDRSDSYIDRPNTNCNGQSGDPFHVLGDNDHSLMQQLSKAGADHRKYMRMMPVYARITAPLYWWKEFDTYKVGTVANSCSTMHKIQEKEFTLDDFSFEHLDIRTKELLEETIKILNDYRKLYIEYNRNDLEIKGCPSKKDIWWQMTSKKNIWWQLIQTLPSSYNQTRNVMMNYEVMTNIYTSRKNHKLDEWREFCKWIENLPLSDLITHNAEKRMRTKEKNN